MADMSGTFWWSYASHKQS